MAQPQYKHLAHLTAFAAEPLAIFTVVAAGRRSVLACSVAHEVLRGLWERSAPRNGWWVGDYLLMPDHVHMLISIPPKYSVSQVVGYIKGKSAIHLAREYGGKKRNFVGQHFWARGYYVSTVGRDEAQIREYIRRQEDEDKRLDQMNLWD